MPDRDLTLAHHSWRWRILVSTYLGYAGYYLTRNVFSSCKKTLEAQHFSGWNNVAHLWTAFLLSYMIGQFLVSVLGRRSSARLLLLVGLGGSIGVNLVFGAANSYATFMFFMCVNGLFQSMGWPGCVGATVQWLRPREQGWFMGIWSTNLLFGNMAVKTCAGFLLGQWGWRYAYFGCALITFGVWLLLLWWQRDKPEDVGLSAIIPHDTDEAAPIAASNASKISVRDYLQIAANPLVLLMSLGYFSVKFIRYSVDSWLPTFLQFHGLNRAAASYWSLAFDLGGFPAMIFTGWALSRLFRGNWALLCAALGIGMTITYAIVSHLSGNDPYRLAICFGVVGFMIYGPDSLLKGVAAVQVAGRRNGLAVAAVVNGFASLAPVIQEETIGHGLTYGDLEGMARAHMVCLGVSIFFVLTMGYTALKLARTNRRPHPPQGDVLPVGGGARGDLVSEHETV